jgi:hypothetical protein
MPILNLISFRIITGRAHSVLTQACVSLRWQFLCRDRWCTALWLNYQIIVLVGVVALSDFF